MSEAMALLEEWPGDCEISRINRSYRVVLYYPSEEWTEAKA